MLAAFCSCYGLQHANWSAKNLLRIRQRLPVVGEKHSERERERQRDEERERRRDRKIVSSQTRALKFARHFNFHFPWPAKQFLKPPQKAFSPGGWVAAVVVVVVFGRQCGRLGQ